MQKLKMESSGQVPDNIRRIAELFPSCVTEIKDGDTVRLAIDFEKLKAELGEEQIIPEGSERYLFTWPGKAAAARLASSPIKATLRPCREESVDFDTTRNLYIEGDNLDVLKLLRETYLGRVKMIYIDPPYNTGNDFVYKDDFRRSTGDYLADSGQFDDQGQRLETNTETNGRYHTDWLNMIYPRLRLARELLTDDGVIFISIDDHEVENLKKVCNEVFGEGNFLVQIIWEKRYTRSNNSRTFTTLTEPILVYRKSILLDDIKEPRTEKADSTYSNPDNDPRGVWTSVSYVNPATRAQRPNLCYPLINPFTNQEVIHPTNAWKFSKDVYEQHTIENRLYWGKDGNNTYPRFKKFLSEMEGGMVPVDLWRQEETGTTDQASKELENLFGAKFFDFPKPVSLIKRILSLIFGKSDKSSLILDFFSGSATTAHAVMQLNAEDGGNRRFIMVQVPEPCAETSEAAKAGYKNICEIGKERIRRAGKKIREEMEARRAKEGLFAGEDAPALDTGFRVLKIASTNMEDVYYSPRDVTQSQLFEQEMSVKADRTGLDLLFQAMLELGITLDADIREEKMEGKTIYRVNDTELIACLDPDVPESVVEQIAKLKPLNAIFREPADDATVTNFDELFKTYSPATDRRII